MFSEKIQWRHVYAMMLRYWLYLRHSLERMIDIFYWPIIELTLWGLTSQYFQTQGIRGDVVFSIISGLLFWTIVNRTQYEVSMNLLAEMWDGNLLNMFVSPLTFTEWLMSTYLIGIIKTGLSFIFAGLIAFILYKVNVFKYGWYILPLSAILTLTGWSIGNLVSAMLFVFGTKVQTMVWAVIALISPFSAIYYPLSALPHWAQIIAKLTPSSYVFENARTLITGGMVDWQEMQLAMGLGFLYLVISHWILLRCFTLTLKRGLLRSN